VFAGCEGDYDRHVKARAAAGARIRLFSFLSPPPASSPIILLSLSPFHLLSTPSCTLDFLLTDCLHNLAADSLGPLIVLDNLHPFHSGSNINTTETSEQLSSGLRIAQDKSVNMVGLVSAAGLVGFLSEPDPELRSFALKQLDSQVDLLWTEIANSVGEMYVLHKVGETQVRHVY
jgi:hypothetical protein